MKIIQTSKRLSKMELYKLMSPETYTNMRDKVGETLKITKFAIHTETDEYNTEKKVLALELEGGELVVSASRSLVAEFEKLIAIFGHDGVKEIDILEAQTGNGYGALSCRLTSMGVA